MNAHTTRKASNIATVVLGAVVAVLLGLILQTVRTGNAIALRAQQTNHVQDVDISNLRQRQGVIYTTQQANIRTLQTISRQMVHLSDKVDK